MLKTSFPQSPMAIFRLMDKIMDKLMHQNSVIAFSIKTAYGDKVPYRQIISTIKSQCMDNESIAIEVFGENLWQEIKDFR